MGRGQTPNFTPAPPLARGLAIPGALKYDAGFHMSLGVMKRRFFLGLGLVLLIAGLAEIGARRALPDIPGCQEEARNPFRFRGFPEYLAGFRQASAQHAVVLISNSQAYAGEYPPANIYPARLERLLNERRVGGHADWKVLNWSSDGMTSIEYVLLAACLRRASPALVLAITGFADYSVEHLDSGFLFCRTDVPRLATRPAVLAGVPWSYLRRHARVEDTLTSLATDRVALYRFREYLWCWLERRFPGAHRAFYAPFVNYLPWNIRGAAWVSALRFPPAPEEENAAFTYTDASRPMLAEYLDALRGLSAPVLVVAEPRRLAAGDARGASDVAFGEDLRAMTAARGLALRDLRDALPAAGYITSSHFHDSNHRRFAELLCRQVGDFLAASGAVPGEGP